MPFTGSHPAAILPFLRYRLPPSALVIGSMSPDLPFYVPVPITGAMTHTLLGAVTLDVVLGAALLAVWQTLVGPAAVAYAPEALRRRLGTGVPAGLGHHLNRPRRLLLTLAALAIGALTHVGWDSFTHATMLGPTHIPWLTGHLGPLPRYEWAQYVSGLAGVATLAWWCRRWWHRQDPAPQPTTIPAGRGRAFCWMVIGLAALGGVAFGALNGLGEQDPVRGALFRAATTGTSTAAMAILLLATMQRLDRDD